MAKPPIDRMRKDEIIKLHKMRCKHGHRYLEHYGCYLKETGNKIRRGFLDIETSNLSADFGIVFCYCIKVEGEDRILERIVTAEDIERDLDKTVIEQFIKDISQFDEIVTYYGTKFDIPFLRTRALYWKLPFPEFGTIQHKDVYYIAKNKLKLHRSRQETVGRTILGKTNKTHFDAYFWIQALRGDPESLGYILDHCRKDVTELEEIYHKVIGYVKNITKSI